MKVIKVGTNAQSRIAQACDRCRSKKIRCDGIRPCCTQCANVGFECKTSDKLSRRAFPRGYTESLEERVRQLEARVRELEDDNELKDEKLDVISRGLSHPAVPLQTRSKQRLDAIQEDTGHLAGQGMPMAKDDCFEVQQTPYLNDDDKAGSYFSGTSSTRNFIHTFNERARESGQSVVNIDTSLLMAIKTTLPIDSTKRSLTDTAADAVPPREIADHLVNVFFQEWAPLFPVLHRSTFLSMYERLMCENDGVADLTEIAQLYLVFGIAALSSGKQVTVEIDSFESKWKAAATAISANSCVATLQTLILAQLYCVQQGDFISLLTYKGQSTTLSARLGLHQSQKRFALDTMTGEVRKRVFWTLFTLDSFTSVMLGLPKHIKEEDVHCEYPIDLGDASLAQANGELPSSEDPPQIAAAIALFDVSRVLSKVVEEVFPTKPMYELSLRKLTELSNELDAWYNSLPPYLRQQISFEKPPMASLGSQSPILSLTYHYIRALIQRPAICASLGMKSASAMISMASSCKHMVQIIELLDARSLGFSFCLNRAEVLLIAAFGLLFQSIGLEMHSKVLRENSKTIQAIVRILQETGLPASHEFEKVAQQFVQRAMPKVTASRHNSEGASTADYRAETRKQLKAAAAKHSSTFIMNSQRLKTPRRASVHSFGLLPRGVRNQSQVHLQSALSHDSRSEPADSPENQAQLPDVMALSFKLPTQVLRSGKPTHPNLDYLSFSNETPSQPALEKTVKSEALSDWEKLLGNLDNGETNIFDACYGGPPVEGLLNAPQLRPEPPATMIHEAMALDANLWTMQSPGNLEQAGSTFSFSNDDGLSSGEDLTAEWASASSSHGEDAYSSLLLPEFAIVDDGNMDIVMNL